MSEINDTLSNQNYITRDEFAQRLDTSVEALTDLIRDQTRSQAREMSELRTDLKASGRPQWQPLSLAFTIFSVVLGALWGVQSNGDAKIDAVLHENRRLHDDHQRVAQQEIQRRLEVVEAWTNTHDKEVSHINSRQDEAQRWHEKELNRMEREGL